MLTFSCTGAINRIKKLDNGSVMVMLKYKSSTASKFPENSTFFLDPKKIYNRADEVLRLKENTILRIDGTLYNKRKEDKTTELKFSVNTVELLTADAINTEGTVKKDFVLDEDCPF